MLRKNCYNSQTRILIQLQVLVVQRPISVLNLVQIRLLFRELQGALGTKQNGISDVTTAG